jgi:PAS domain S-box-containing protein
MMIIGRYVDDVEIQLLTEGTTPSLSFQPLDPSTVPQPDLTLLTGPGDSAIVVQPVDENTVLGKKVFRDIYGRDALLLTVQLSRGIYDQGKETIFIFIMLQLGILLVLGILGVMVLDKTVLARMSAISSDITGITGKKNSSARILITGNDELSRLAVAMNMLLDQIEKNQSDLQENEQKFREIFNNVNDGIELHEVRSDGLPGKYLEVNDVTSSRLQYSREELLRHSPLDYNTGYFSRPIDDLGKEINTLGHSRFETEHRRKDGTVVPVEINAHVVTLNGKKMVISAVRDITERKKFEEALREVIKKLNILSSITRHDILNQLSSLRGYLELSKQRATDSILCDFISKEENAAAAIQDQINFTKDYEDIGIHSPQWQDIKQSILQAIHPLNIEPVRVVVDIENTEIYADPLLEKVFFNLVENAVRHGGTITTIIFTQNESEDGLLISCEDDGVGIPIAEKVNIFNRKYFTHTGLGLFLAQEILGMTGIGFRETGEPGKGARFEISVPKGGYRFSGAR